MFGFSGSRSLHRSHAGFVGSVVGVVANLGMPMAVGCAAGLDALVRQDPRFSGSVFRAESRYPSALVARSVSMVRAVAGSQPSALLIFPGCPCPSGLVPSSNPRQCFCGRGSGTWASAALAVGLGVPLYLFAPGSRSVASSWVPSSWGSWEPTCRFGVISHRLVYSPPAQQLSLF